MPLPPTVESNVKFKFAKIAGFQNLLAAKIAIAASTKVPEDPSKKPNEKPEIPEQPPIKPEEPPERPLDPPDPAEIKDPNFTKWR